MRVVYAGVVSRIVFSAALHQNSSFELISTCLDYTATAGPLDPFPWGTGCSTSTGGLAAGVEAKHAYTLYHVSIERVSTVLKYSNTSPSIITNKLLFRPPQVDAAVHFILDPKSCKGDTKPYETDCRPGSPAFVAPSWASPFL